ncbi:MAG: ABC transporter substrate-binding protein [Gemmatimonadota bacterium]
MTTRRLLNRGFTRVLLTTAALALASACGDAGRPDAGRDDGPAPRPEVPEAERYGGTVVVARRNDIGSMNAFESLDIESQQHQIHLLFVTLVRGDERDDPLPYLARSWSFTEDSAAVTFELHRGLTWHDGTPLTARDVEFTYERARDPAVGYPNHAYFDAWNGVELLDEYTLRFTIRPMANLFFGWTRLPILPEHVLGDVPPAELAGHPFGSTEPVGAGPFRFVERSAGDRWVFEANPDFPDELGGRPYVDRYVYRVIAEDATRAAALRTGEIDLLMPVAPANLPRFAADSAIRLLEYREGDYDFIVWNPRRPMFADRAVRRALTMAIDRQGIVEAVHEGAATVATGPVGPWHWAYDSTDVALDHAPDSARAALEAAGWTDADGDGVREKDGRPFSFTMFVTPRDKWRSIATIVQSNLADVGVEMEIEVREIASLQPLVTSPDRRFDAFMLTWVPDPTMDGRSMWACDQVAHPVHFSSYCNPELDAVLDSLLSATDREVYARLVDRYNDILAEDQPYTFLYHPTHHAAARVELRGVEMDVGGNWATVADWWLEPAAR